MDWWLWIIAGLALLAVEMLIPGLIVFIFFGVAALVLGLLDRLGLAGPIWFQWVLFSVLSVASLITLRGPILKWLHRRSESQPEIDTLEGQVVVLKGDLAPGRSAKAELRGASWSVVGSNDETLPKGSQCVVESVDGLTLHVRPAATADAETSS